jgi:hypothetical protein
MLSVYPGGLATNVGTILPPVFGVYAALAVLLAASVTIGLALWRLSGWERASACAPAAGFALLLVVTEIAAHLPGRTVTAAAVAGALFLGSLVVLVAAPYPRGAGLGGAVLVVGVSLVLVALPFIGSGGFGILGEGDNNDMAVHLGAAYWLQTHAIQQDVMLVKPGYPLGPHALAATLGTGLRVSVLQGFTAVMLAVPVLTALTALAGLERLRRGWRFVGALFVGFAYLVSSYFAQAAFKETTEALLLLAFVLGLREFAGELRWPRPRQAVPLGVLAAASVYVYSYNGIAWPAAALIAAVVFAALQAGPAFPQRGAMLLRDAALPLAAGLLVCAVAVAPDIGRMIDFSHSHYAHEPPNGTGNLAHKISPAQALGVWLASDFRFNPHPRVLTVICLVLAGVALVWALARWWRDGDLTVPTALVAAIALYLYATHAKNIYNSAKALPILAPLVMLLIVSVLLPQERPRQATSRRGLERFRLPLALIVLLPAAWSSFIALRDAPVGSDAHDRELAAIRHRIAGQKTLFLVNDDFGVWLLRGAVVARPAFLYSPWIVELNPQKPFRGGEPLDFDSVPADTLAQVRYIVTSRTPFHSSIPEGVRPVASTPSYELWERVAQPRPRRVLAEDGQPAATLDCTQQDQRAVSRTPGVAHVLPPPVVGHASDWSGSVRGAGESGSQQLHLPAGGWDISLQYVSRQPMRVRSSTGLDVTLPGDLERLGAYWFAGTVRSDGTKPVTITATTQRLPLAARLLGAPGKTRALVSPEGRPLGALVATRHGAGGQTIPLSQACGRYVDWYRFKGDAAG